MGDRGEFKERIRAWADKIGVEYREVHFRAMRTKWGSCSTRGRLTFDPSLLEKEEGKQDEIIVHELLHFRYPKHGKMFYTMLRMYLRKADHDH